MPVCQILVTRLCEGELRTVGRDRQIANGLDWPGRERRTGREAVCACRRMQEPALGICAGESIMSVRVEKLEDFNILHFKLFST